MSARAAATRFCPRCGRGDDEVAFRNPLAMKCVECDEMTEEERKEYHREYHKARAMAVKDLISKFPDDYQRMLAKRRRQIARARRTAAA